MEPSLVLNDCSFSSMRSLGGCISGSEMKTQVPATAAIGACIQNMARWIGQHRIVQSNRPENHTQPTAGSSKPARTAPNAIPAVKPAFIMPMNSPLRLTLVRLTIVMMPAGKLPAAPISEFSLLGLHFLKLPYRRPSRHGLRERRAAFVLRM